MDNTDSARRDVLLSCGAVLDHCLTALAAVGWASTVRRFPDPDDPGKLAHIDVVELPARHLNIELATAIRRRRADRRRYGGRPIPAGTLELFHIRAARCGVTMGVVPKIRWVRLDDGDIDLRYGDAAYGVADAQDAGAVVVVLGTDTDNDRARLQAGETLSQLVLAATEQGLASCPLTRALNDTRDRLALACEVFDGDAYPQALIRLGWAPADSEALAPVERRPVSETTEWDLDA